jgi:hypothetical protein
MAADDPPTAGFADAADWPASPRPLHSTAPSWTQMAPLPQSYEAYEAACEGVAREGWIEAGSDLIDDNPVERTEALELPSRARLQSIVDQAAVAAIDDLRSQKA